MVLAGWDRKTPQHDSKIEAAAHRLACQRSCRFQEWAAREQTAERPDQATCPGCDQVCPLELQGRIIQSADGPVPNRESKGTDEMSWNDPDGAEAILQVRSTR